MDDEKILSILKEYLDNPQMNYAVLIDGSWGSGKTFFIKNKFIKNNKKYLYISLNGVNNKETINKKIYYKIIENNIPEKIRKSKGLEVTKKSRKAIFSISNELIKKLFRIDISEVKNIDYSEIISIFNDISEYIIVFDDLERCQMPISEILGYINEYVEHRNVKCIIVANEQEIRKINYNDNYELKVLSCLRDDIDYGEKKEVIEYNKRKTDNKKTDISQIKDRILNMYEGNTKYNLVKEKLIGLTLKYNPNISKVYDQLIINYKKQDKNFYNFLKENKDNCISILGLNNCNNIRTILFMLDRFNALYNEIKRIDLEQSDIIINLVFRNVIFSSIGIKRGLDIKKILDGAMYKDKVSLSTDSRQNNSYYYTAFNFVDDFITEGNIDKEKMKKSIDYYLDVNYENIEENDPYNKLNSYWELEDEELRNSMKQILINIEQNKYSYKLFPKIIYSLSCIENLGFEKELIQNILDKIELFIEKNKIDYIDFHVWARDEKVAEIYNKNIKKIREKMEIQNNNQTIANLNNILKSKNWGIELYKYVMSQNYLSKKQFLNEFDIDSIIKNIKKSDSINIYNFKYCLDRVYNFSNLREFYLKDLENITKLIKELEKMDKASFGVTKKEAIEYLNKILIEKKELLEN